MAIAAVGPAAGRPGPRSHRSWPGASRGAHGGAGTSVAWQFARCRRPPKPSRPSMCARPWDLEKS